MSKTCRAVAFDLDGTLVDSIPGLAAATDAMLAACQLPGAGEAQVTNWVGNGVDVLIQRAWQWATGQLPAAEQLQKARALFDQHYAGQIATGNRLYPEVKATLSALAQRGLQLAIVTNKPSVFVRPVLQALAIESLFSLVLGGDDVPHKKPDPAPLRIVLETWQLAPEQLLFVGDSRNDILAAQRAGCRSAGVTWGYNYGEPIAVSQPDRVVAHFSELLTLPELRTAQ